MGNLYGSPKFKDPNEIWPLPNFQWNMAFSWCQQRVNLLHYPPKTLFKGTPTSSPLDSCSPHLVLIIDPRSRSTMVNPSWLSTRYRSQHSYPIIETQSWTTSVKYIEFFNLSRSRSRSSTLNSRLSYLALGMNWMFLGN